MQVAKPELIIMCLILSIVQNLHSITLICKITPEMVSDFLPSFFPLTEFYILLTVHHVMILGK